MSDVAIIIPTLSNGGAERIVSLISTSLADKYNISILLYNNNITYEYKGDIKIVNTKISNKIIKQFDRGRKIFDCLNEIDPDITLSFLTNPNIMNSFFGKGKKVISVRNMRSNSLKNKKGKIYSAMIKNRYNKVDKIIAISEGVKKDLINNFDVDKELIEVIYNFCDLDFIKKKRTKDILEKEKTIFNANTVITAGRLHEQKGHWHLIRAFKKVIKEVKDAQLIILGKGELSNYLKELTSDLDLNNNVHFLGFKTNPFKYYYNSDLFVFPSLYEGFGNVILEAMACDLPIISTDCLSGPREILTDNINYKLTKKEYGEYGVLVPVFNGIKHSYQDNLTYEENVMADTIIEFLNNDDLRNKYKYKSKKRVKKFTVDNIIKEWNHLIENLILS